MKKYDVIKRIMESNRLNESDQAYYMEMFLSGVYTADDLKWIWE